jgi:hypothetical protein
VLGGINLSMSLAENGRKTKQHCCVPLCTNNYDILMKEDFCSTNFQQNNPQESKYILPKFDKTACFQQSKVNCQDGSIYFYIIVTLKMCMQRSRGW